MNLLKNLKIFLQFGKATWLTTASKSNFYYICGVWIQMKSQRLRLPFSSSSSFFFFFFFMYVDYTVQETLCTVN